MGRRPFKAEEATWTKESRKETYKFPSWLWKLASTLAGEEALRREIMWGRFFQVSSCRAFYTKMEFGPFAATGNLFFIVWSRLSVKVY